MSDLADLEYRIGVLVSEHLALAAQRGPLPRCACGANIHDGTVYVQHAAHIAEVVSAWLQREGIVGGPAGG